MLNNKCKFSPPTNSIVQLIINQAPTNVSSRGIEKKPIVDIVVGNPYFRVMQATQRQLLLHEEMIMGRVCNT